MKIAITTSIVWLALAMLPAAAKSPSAVEDAKEIDPTMLTLPSVPGGTLAFQKCGACKRFTHELRQDARFFVEKVEVTYEQFKRHVASHPEGLVLVVTSIPENTVTRLVAQ
jgi:hypothetical protein